MEKRFKCLLAGNEETYDGIWDNDGEKIYSEFKGICNLLNEQDEKIKELQSELNSKNNIIWDKNDKAVLCGDCYCLNNDVRKLVEENQQLKQQLEEKDKEIKRLLNNWKNSKLQQTRLYNELKQSQNSKAIEALENIVKFMDGDIYSNYYPMAYEIKEFILEQITKLRGGEND